MAATKPPLVGGVGTPGAAIGDGDGTPGATSGAGSIAEIGERLRLWARRSGAGLARVEFIDETARRQVVAKLHRALADEAIALHEIGFDVLPVDDPTPPPAVGARLADELLARLRQLPPGVVSLDGLAAALPPAPADLAAALYAFNLRREALAATAQRQIWWMPPHFATAFVQAVPDLDSWFLVRLHLRETRPARPWRDVDGSAGDWADDRSRYIAIVSHAGSGRDADRRLDPAARRRLAADYAARYERGVLAGTADVELAPLRERAVEILRAGDLADEAAALARRLAATAAGLSAAPEASHPPRDADGARRVAVEPEEQTFVALEHVIAALDPVAEELFRRLAWLAPAPIPDTLLDTPAPASSEHSAAAPTDALRTALVELERRALVRRSDDGKSVLPHPAAQAASRNRQRQAARQTSGDGVPPALRAALVWLDDAFVGEPWDVRDWPRLEPLAPHARTVAEFADQAAIAEPTTRLFNQTALLFYVKARYGDAEPLMRRALAIDEASLGREHPSVAIDLNNLATLLQDTNRLADAEPLMRRALAIDEASLGREHPSVAIRLNNLAQLLQATNRLADAEPLMRRALAIDEASLGREHPSVARDLNNLATLLQATNRLADAEPLLHRALAITEVSLGGEHPHTQLVRQNTIELLRALGRSDDEIAATLAAVRV